MVRRSRAAPATKIDTDCCPTDGVFTMALDLTWLRTWVEVVDAGGFARAAELVHLSQPRVSAHISNLEKELGCSLIERRVRPLTLTEEGKALLPRARAVLAAADELMAGVLAERGIVSGAVKVASFASASSEFLPAVVSQLEREHPHIDLSIRDGDVRTIEAALSERRVAVALRPMRPEPRDRSFSVRPLWREPFVVVLPAGHPLLADDVIDPRQLTGERVITIGNPLSDEGLGSEAESAFSSIHRQLPAGSVSDQPSTLGAMVRAGHGIGVMNYLGFAMIRQDGLEIRELGIDHYRDVGIWWHSERPLTEAAQAFIITVMAAQRPEGTWEIPAPR
jgi:LysR family hydrogen peroxide-inducible transcriptional activator